MKKFVFFVFLLFVGFTLMGQPIKLDWEEDLIGDWKVIQIDTMDLPEHINMFLEIKSETLNMHNQSDLKKAKWRVDEQAQHQQRILIQTESGEEPWLVKSVDANQLTLYDELGKATLYLRKHNGPMVSVNNLAQTAAKSDLLGTWLFVSANQQSNAAVKLDLSFFANGNLSIETADQLQKVKWRLNQSGSRVMVFMDNEQPLEWLLKSVEANRLELTDNGMDLTFVRYIEPMTTDKEQLLLGDWQVTELGGKIIPEAAGKRSLKMLKDGQLLFFNNQQKELDAAWGLNEAKNAIFIVSSAGQELWNILYVDKASLLLEMDGLKMLLEK